jgi:hypothetical protein
VQWAILLVVYRTTFKPLVIAVICKEETKQPGRESMSLFLTRWRDFLSSGQFWIQKRRKNECPIVAQSHRILPAVCANQNYLFETLGAFPPFSISKSFDHSFRRRGITQWTGGTDRFLATVEIWYTATYSRAWRSPRRSRYFDGGGTRRLPRD